jgi:hypothetical protein
MVERGHAAGFGGAVEDPDGGVRECLLDGGEELDGRRRRAGIGETDRRHVEHAPFGSVQIVEDPAPHGGDAVEPLGPVADDGPADGDGVGGGQQDDGVPSLPLLQCDGPRPHVEEGVRADHRPTALEQGAGVGAQVVDAVGEHGPLGPARAAAGEEDDVGVVLGRRRRARLAAVSCVVQGHEVCQGRHLGVEAAGERPPGFDAILVHDHQ